MMTGAFIQNFGTCIRVEDDNENGPHFEKEFREGHEALRFIAQKLKLGMPTVDVRLPSYSPPTAEMLTIKLPKEVAEALRLYCADTEQIEEDAIIPLLKEFLERQKYLS